MFFCGFLSAFAGCSGAGEYENGEYVSEKDFSYISVSDLNADVTVKTFEGAGLKIKCSQNKKEFYDFTEDDGLTVKKA
ncbi:MAG: hypothetical protein J6Z34_06450 [Clostridia bacterium]|nr:hypothetical protein [Clostridia bacterium]